MTPLEVLLLSLLPFTFLGVWDRRKAIANKIEEWTRPNKPQAPKEPKA